MEYEPPMSQESTYDARSGVAEALLKAASLARFPDSIVLPANAPADKSQRAFGFTETRNADTASLYSSQRRIALPRSKSFVSSPIIPGADVVTPSRTAVSLIRSPQKVPSLERCIPAASPRISASSTLSNFALSALDGDFDGSMVAYLSQDLPMTDVFDSVSSGSTVPNNNLSLFPNRVLPRGYTMPITSSSAREFGEPRRVLELRRGQSWTAGAKPSNTSSASLTTLPVTPLKPPLQSPAASVPHSPAKSVSSMGAVPDSMSLSGGNGAYDHSGSDAAMEDPWNLPTIMQLDTKFSADDRIQSLESAALFAEQPLSQPPTPPFYRLGSRNSLMSLSSWDSELKGLMPTLSADPCHRSPSNEEFRKHLLSPDDQQRRYSLSRRFSERSLRSVDSMDVRMLASTSLFDSESVISTESDLRSPIQSPNAPTGKELIPSVEMPPPPRREPSARNLVLSPAIPTSSSTFSATDLSSSGLPVTISSQSYASSQPPLLTARTMQLPQFSHAELVAIQQQAMQQGVRQGSQHSTIQQVADEQLQSQNQQHSTTPTQGAGQRQRYLPNVPQSSHRDMYPSHHYGRERFYESNAELPVPNPSQSIRIPNQQRVFVSQESLMRELHVQRQHALRPPVPPSYTTIPSSSHPQAHSPLFVNSTGPIEAAEFVPSQIRSQPRPRLFQSAPSYEQTSYAAPRHDGRYVWVPFGSRVLPEEEVLLESDQQLYDSTAHMGAPRARVSSAPATFRKRSADSLETSQAKLARGEPYSRAEDSNNFYPYGVRDPYTQPQVFSGPAEFDSPTRSTGTYRALSASPGFASENHPSRRSSFHPSSHSSPISVDTPPTTQALAPVPVEPVHAWMRIQRNYPKHRTARKGVEIKTE